MCATKLDYRNDPFRLSPIGEGSSKSTKDVIRINVQQASTSTKRSSYESGATENGLVS